MVAYSGLPDGIENRPAEGSNCFGFKAEGGLKIMIPQKLARKRGIGWRGLRREPKR